ncbi:MAB_1171c family putative transporter [Streptomyces sp. NPDC052496]|uniref:MAB_1171c family putative transporter n=1 Tax=Streptomyces sp. NPDC052496 TaxID=3154951 RepID=UPI00341E5BCA
MFTWIGDLAWLENTGIVALWAVVLARAPRGLKDPAQRPLWFAIVMIALAMSMHLEPVTAALARLVPGAHWVDLSTHLFSIVDAAAVLWFIFQAAGRQRRTVLVFGAALAVMLALVALDLTGPPHARNQITPSPDIPSVPDAYWYVFFAFHLTADTTCGIVCWTQGRTGAPRLLRYGLRLFGTGILLASLLWVLKLCYLQTRSPVFGPLFSPVTGVEALFIAAGVALPVLAGIQRLWRDRASYRGLAVLWRELTAVTPDVVLGPGSRLRDAVLPLQLRLYRRVIEIRDAMIVLRDYVSPATLDGVRRHVGEQAVPEHLADAHITACWLAAALHARRAGEAPHAQTANLAGPGAGDLGEEVRHLLRIADAYRSPVVRAYRAAHVGSG